MSPGAFGASALSMLGAIGAAFAVTVATEVVVAAALGLRTARELGVVVLGNLITNPAVNLLVAAAMALSGAQSIAEPVVLLTVMLLEIAAVLVEWRILAYALPARRERALGLSIAMNAASLMVGLLVFGAS